MTLKANGSFGYGGSGSGGGGGEVNTASNVGTGVQVFKQKTGVDLEFRTLLPNGISANNALILDQNADTIEITVRTGTFGISNGQGYYTFYTTLSAAITAATSGQTIVMFDNVTETTATPINLKDGVNIDLNGHTYTNDVAGSVNAIQDNNVAVKCTISNGKIIRTGATTPAITNNCSLNVQNSASEVRLENVQLLHEDGSALYTNGTVFGGFITSNWSDDNNGIYVDGNGILIGSEVFGNTELFLGGTLNNCYIYSECLNVDNRIISAAIESNGGYINNCVVEANLGWAVKSFNARISASMLYSQAQTALDLNVGANVANSYVRSSGSNAVNGTGLNAQNSVFETDVNYGGDVSSCVAQNCTFISLANSAFNSPVNGRFFNCHFRTFGGALGLHGLRVTNTPQYVFGCTFEVNNAGNFAILGAGGTPTDIYAVMNKAYLSTVMFDNINNVQSNTMDLYGNILVG